MEGDDAVGTVAVSDSSQLGDSGIMPPMDVQPVPAADVDDDDVDELLEKIVKQVEYYFSDENLATDNFMLGHLKRNKQGLVPLSVIASFKKLKKLTKETSIIVTALRKSSNLVVSSDGIKIKRQVPFDFKKVQLNESGLVSGTVVLVENLPEDRSVENLHKIFGVAGSVKKISVIDPQAVEASSGEKVQKVLINSNKVHALVEYETVEAAEKAVTTLNCESDWRSGMRVKMHKNVDKFGQRKTNTAWKGAETDKKKNRQQKGHQESSEHRVDGNSLEDGKLEEKALTEGQGHGRSRGKKHYNSFGHCIGAADTHATEAPKPLPGPKMPDGTRGFSRGRGQPLASIPN